MSPTEPRQPSGLSRRTFLRAAGVSAVVLPIAAGCSRTAATSGSTTSQPATTAPVGSSAGASRTAQNLGSITLPAPSLGLLGNAPLHIAVAQGYFKDAGVDVQLADVIGTDVIRAIQTTSPIGVAGCLPMAVAFSKGVKGLRIVAPMYGAAQTDFIAPANGSVKTLADLKAGMKIGGSIPATPPTYFAAAVIKKAGLTPSQVQIINLGRAPDSWTAAQKGLVDLTWSNPPFDTTLIQSGKAVRVISAAALVPKWLDTALATTQKNIDEKGDVVAAVIVAVGRARQLILTDPATAAKAWAHNAKLDPAVTTAALKAAPAAAWAPVIDPAAVQACIDAGHDVGSITGAVDLSVFVSNKFA